VATADGQRPWSPRGRGEPFLGFLARHLGFSVLLYAGLFALVFFLALASAYAWPWLLDPAPR